MILVVQYIAYQFCAVQLCTALFCFSVFVVIWQINRHRPSQCCPINTAVSREAPVQPVETSSCGNCYLSSITVTRRETETKCPGANFTNRLKLSQQSLSIRFKPQNRLKSVREIGPKAGIHERAQPSFRLKFITFLQDI